MKNKEIALFNKDTSVKENTSNKPGSQNVREAIRYLTYYSFYVLVFFYVFYYLLIKLIKFLHKSSL